jgi:hypothetical protein
MVLVGQTHIWKLAELFGHFQSFVRFVADPADLVVNASRQSTTGHLLTAGSLGFSVSRIRGAATFASEAQKEACLTASSKHSKRRRANTPLHPSFRNAVAFGGWKQMVSLIESLVYSSRKGMFILPARNCCDQASVSFRRGSEPECSRKELFDGR